MGCGFRWATEKVKENTLEKKRYHCRAKRAPQRQFKNKHWTLHATFKDKRVVGAVVGKSVHSLMKKVVVRKAPPDIDLMSQMFRNEMKCIACVSSHTVSSHTVQKKHIQTCEAEGHRQQQLFSGNIW